MRNRRARALNTSDGFAVTRRPSAAYSSATTMGSVDEPAPDDDEARARRVDVAGVGPGWPPSACAPTTRKPRWQRTRARTPRGPASRRPPYRARRSRAPASRPCAPQRRGTAVAAALAAHAGRLRCATQLSQLAGSDSCARGCALRPLAVTLRAERLSDSRAFFELRCWCVVEAALAVAPSAQHLRLLRAKTKALTFFYSVGLCGIWD